MKIKLLFRPPVDKVKPGLWNFLAKIDYTPFPEMMNEYKAGKYDQEDGKDKGGEKDNSHMYTLEVDNDDPDLPEYFLELDRPYGTYTVQVFYHEIVDPLSENKPEIKPLEDNLLLYFRGRC